MYSLAAKQKRAELIYLSLFHIVIIASTNYLVQLPIAIFGFSTTWGTFTFPCIFLTTDLTVRIFGAPLARGIIILNMIPALFISYAISTITYQGIWHGFAEIGRINIFVARISIASFIAYIIGQILDIQVFHRLQKKCNTWWPAPIAAMLLGNISDTLSFFFIAFYHSSDTYMDARWVENALVDYSFKVLIYMLLFFPIYGILLNSPLKHIVIRKILP